jgi:ATP-dependent exoDNAse (exonuclease V) alpha subunit
MPDYDFKCLSPIDFEILTRDLLQKKLNLTFESFKSGKDKGIDFRHTTDTGNSLIVQCKHYVGSGIKVLLSTLNSDEKEKVKKLNPNKYIVATSVPLSPADKEKIKSIFTPYVKTTGDIFGQEDLNNLLGIFPEIEKKTIKLWVSSAGVLEEILHSKVVNISNIEIEKIQKHAKFYVYNESFSEAQNILNNQNFCIISGVPGIGKTTLAEMLSLSFIDSGWEIVKVTDDISDAISLGLHGKKRLFYYDDFLGQTSFGEKLNKNEDQRLIDFIGSIKKSMWLGTKL